MLKENVIKNTITHYERHFAELTSAIDELNAESITEELMDSEQCNPLHELDELGLYDPDHACEHKDYDFGPDLGPSVKCDSKSTVTNMSITH